MSRSVRQWMFWIWAAAALLPVAAQAPPREGAAYEKVKDWVDRFETSERVSWQMPSAVLRLLGLKAGDRVADIGAGTGYFLPYLSAIVAQNGTVWAVDIDADMLAYVKERTFSFDNVETVLAAPDDPRLPDGGVDAILIVDTWHHIEDRVTYLERMRQALTERGRVAVVDFHKRELPVGPPLDHKLDRQVVVNEFEKGGFRLVGESTVLPYQYFLIFGPPIVERPLSTDTDAP